MGSLKIIKAGLMTSIQDKGRNGLAFYAIPKSGVMDQQSANMAHLLLGHAPDYPIIECNGIAPSIEFLSDTQITLTGADFSWTINNLAIDLNKVIDIKQHDVLIGDRAKNGWRGYIGINGKLNLPKIYASYATYTNAKIGGLEGRLFTKGDLLNWTEEAFIESNIQLDISFTADGFIPIKKGPEYDWLAATSKISLTENMFSLHPDSNRMGARLDGSPLSLSKSSLKNSVPVLPGFIQIPPNGQPIVLLNDGQVTGGYPRIAYIPDNYLSAFNQLEIGTNFQFRLMN